MPELVFFRRGEEVLRFGLDRSRTVLGRGDKSDVMIPDPTVSRRQAVLLYDGQSTTLERTKRWSRGGDHRGDRESHRCATGR